MTLLSQTCIASSVPVGLFSARADAAFVETLRARWRAMGGG